mgnify:CR=1 FL=1
MISKYLEQFTCFQYKCNFPVKSTYKNITKYHVIYGTRHKDGLILMNDIMYKSRERFLQAEFAEGRLFDMRPSEEEKNREEFEKMILDVVKEYQPIKRKDIMIQSILEGIFCKYSDSDYNKTIKKLLQEDKLHKTDGKIEEAKFYIK